MAITRTYTTKKECCELFVSESFDNIKDSLVLDQTDFHEDWEFKGIDDETGELDYCYEPMWGTYFQCADSWITDSIERREKEVAELGFTLIYNEGYFWGLGIDGAGYDFYTQHWIPLYDLLGFHWHDED